MSGGEGAHVLYYSLWLIPLAIAFFLHSRRAGLPAVARALGIWLVIITAAAAVYVNRERFGPMLGAFNRELNPAGGQAVGDAMVYTARTDGHFWVSGAIGEVETEFMVDTGASAIALNRQTAERLGMPLAELPFTAQVSTANGIARAAPVRLTEVRVGSIRMRDVDALVLMDGLETNLLGMSFLRRLGHYKVEGDRLTLAP